MLVTRRAFCAAGGAAALTAMAHRPSLAERPGTTAQTDRPLRVIAYNVYGCTGWPKDRMLARRAVAQDQMAERLALELSLHQPDLINFSESPAEAITERVAERMGMHHARFPSGGSWPGTLLSRYPLSAVENVPLGRPRPSALFTRHWGRATVTLPEGESILIHSAHLHPAADPAIRLQEVRAMLETMREDIDSGRSMILMGDLNHQPAAEEYRLWRDAGWVDTFAKVGKGEGLTFTADTPSIRIDYVWAAGSIAERTVESRPLYSGAFRLDPHDLQAFALSDHLPQLAAFAMHR